MMTIAELYERFSHTKEWQRLACVMSGRVSDIILRPHGDTDATRVTRETLKEWLRDSRRPMEDIVPVASVINHMMTWAGIWTKEVVTLKQKENAKSNTKNQAPRSSQHHSEGKARRNQTETKAQPMANSPRVEKCKKERRLTAQRPKKVKDSENIVNNGSIYHDTSSRGYTTSGRRVFHDCYRSEIVIDGERYRHRSNDREDCVAWLKAVKQGKIRPTDNKADWWRMEQRKDDNVRIDEIIVNQAEESMMLYDYHQTGDITKINEYLERRLLPHMAWYCAHTLKFGKERTITASRQAAALLLTRITTGKPVRNFTFTCKRMLRVNKQRGDFFYYEKAPEPVKLLVNGMNFDGLAEVWKVTKDRRL